MTPLLSKLTMCVCAAGTGAVVMPAAHIVQRHLAPHRAVVHRAVRAPLVDVAAVRPDCLPGVAAASGGGNEGGGGGDGLALFAPAVAGAAVSGTGGFPFGGFGGAPGSGGGGGFNGGGQPGEEGPGGTAPGMPLPPGMPTTPGLPSVPVNPSSPSIPSTSNAPEPASWVLMVAGFGAVGGAIRYRRIVAV